MSQLLINDWQTSPLIHLVSKITTTNDDCLHNHNFFEIFYVLEGSITHVYNGKKEVLEMNDIRLLRPAKDHHEFVRTTSTSCMHRDIIISEPLFKKCCDFIDPSLFERVVNAPAPLQAKLTQSKIVEFEKSFSERFFIATDKSFYTKEGINNVLTVDLLNVFLQEFQSVPNGLPLWLQTLLPLFSIPKLMREGLDSIIKEISYDKSYICRSFKKYIGCTMTEYLRNKRLDYAVSLLLTTDKTIAQICEEIGFESIPYFTVSFKEKYALSPKQFKLKFK